MSTKNNALVAVAAAALGMVVAGGASPICEGLINDLNVTAFGAAEVDSAGRVLAIVSILDGSTTTVRPVADSSGNVKLFGDMNAAMSAAKRANVTPGAIIKVTKFVKAASIGDPLAALKAKYKRFKAEVVTSDKQVVMLAGKVSAAEALGWDTAVGTPENLEYVDLTNRADTVDEWKSYNVAQVAALAAALTAAGVNPATVV